MIKTILFDLDDTLLGNDMDTFLPQYFSLLDGFANEHLHVANFLPAVLKASQIMVANKDPLLTNNAVFWTEIKKLTGIDRVEAEPLFEEFYRVDFEQLQGATSKISTSAELIRTCFRDGYKLVIATNPMFPRSAVEARLRWAGIPVDEFAYALVTTIENMHATKPHDEYYGEILEMVNCAPQDALMVGDDWKRDIEPAVRMGLSTYWIQLPGKTLPGTPAPSAYGSLAGLLAKLEAGWLTRVAETV